jgi:hypothetical protein
MFREQIGLVVLGVLDDPANNLMEVFILWLK